ncbi:MAG: RNA-binding transcriptional accessory protein [Oscillospiraceae bacterium]|nr:RNA-binding transcriptional accessory protein [Oscillospiraceae bacterium]
MKNIQKLITQLTLELKLRADYIENVITLIDDGNTIPFIARYRKELHGSMDDTQLRDLSDRLTYLRNLDKRREEIINSIDSQGKLTDELKEAIAKAETLAKLEDIYRPYKQKRRTRATIAREKGLEPLAELLFAQELKEGVLTDIASEYVDSDKGVETPEEALQGAADIIAEEISDDAKIRELLKTQIGEYEQLVSKANVKSGEEVPDSVYELYYDFSEPLKNLQSHRVLAINRGEKEKFLNVSIQANDVECIKLIRKTIVKHNSISSEFVSEICEDSYERLIFPSLEREFRSMLTETASEQAIKMFGLNLKPTLMQPPVKNMPTMGFDPAYRTGCKIAVVDENGKLLETGVVYPTAPHNKTGEATKTLARMLKTHKIKAIAIGNGTASKESEIFVAEMLKSPELSGLGISYMVVNEAGASVYSASKLAAAEFPELDVSLRSAVSIARRLQDPLAELVKIDPKSIGVGQYQHDMPSARLDETLAGVVEDCVNSVGVDVNSASPALLSYISGLNTTTATNIVAFREENGAYTARNQIKKVPKVGPKAFEQCAGFLRISGGKNVLDNTGVHPESYKVAEKILEKCDFSIKDIVSGELEKLRAMVSKLSVTEIANECNVGVPTISDIIKELLKPGRDPRDELPPTMLRTDVMDMKDLKSGMTLTGTVRNVIDFGAFVDIGVHQDGLVHISELCNKFVKHPSEIVKVGDIVNVTVLSVDANKKRISLSMKSK